MRIPAALGVASLALSLSLATSISSAAPSVTPTEVAPRTGTLDGRVDFILANPDNTSPVFKGACSDLEVIATPSTGAPATLKATGDVGAGRCSFKMTLPARSYTIDLRIEGRSVMPRAAVSPSVDVRAGQTTATALKAVWPTYPTGVVKGGIDISSNSFLKCGQIKVTVVHALKTFMLEDLQETTNAPTKCWFHFNWVPWGPVTVTLSNALVPNMSPPQTATVNGTSAVILSFALPKYAEIRTRIKPAAYPQPTPGLDCSPYEFAVKKEATVVASLKLANEANITCAAQTLKNLPVGVPVTWELKKNGAVIQSATLTLAPDQFVDKIITGLP